MITAHPNLREIWYHNDCQWLLDGLHYIHDSRIHQSPKRNLKRKGNLYTHIVFKTTRCTSLLFFGEVFVKIVLVRTRAETDRHCPVGGRDHQPSEHPCHVSRGHVGKTDCTAPLETGTITTTLCIVCTIHDLIQIRIAYFAYTFPWIIRVGIPFFLLFSFSFFE